MNQAELDSIRKKLREQRRAILEEALAHLDADSASPLETGDPVDRTERELERALDHRINLDDSHLIHKIDHALQRIEEGTYGKCDYCGVEIPWERLLAKPSVSSCLPCQQSKEDRSRVESIR